MCSVELESKVHKDLTMTNDGERLYVTGWFQESMLTIGLSRAFSCDCEIFAKVLFKLGWRTI